LYENLVNLFYDPKGKPLTNPVVNIDGNTEQSEENNPKYKNHILLHIKDSAYIDAIMKAVKEKKEENSIQTPLTKAKVAENQPISMKTKKLSSVNPMSFWSRLTTKASDILETGKQTVRAYFPHSR
jgi:hypothetical protein